jgi:hypothetical protein
MIVWQYTYSHHIEKIMESGALLPPRLVPSLAEQCNLDGNAAFAGDKKMLLFSANPEWEPSSYRSVIINGESVPLHNLTDYAKYDFTVYRIGADTSILKPWVRLTKLARIPRDMVRALEDSARGLGSNPFDFWGTLFPVRSDGWKSIETFDGSWKKYAHPQNSKA